MIRDMSIIVSSFSSSILLRLRCFLLLAKNLILIKTLAIDLDPVCTSVMFQDHQLHLFWKVSGCHKVIIDDHNRIPGNVEGVLTKYDPSRTTIRFTFYGIAKQETRTILIQVSEVKFPEQFEIELSIPSTRAIAYSQEELTVASHGFLLRDDGLPFSKLELTSMISGQDLVVNLGTLSVHFNPVNLTELIES